jgi:hypothetical protein
MTHIFLMFMDSYKSDTKDYFEIDQDIVIGYLILVVEKDSY